MTQVHYIVTDNRDEEVVTVNLSANKGKINKIAKDFVPTEDEWGDRNRISAGPSSESYKDGFMLIFDSGDFYCEAGTEEDFRSQAESLEYCAFFTKVKNVEIFIPLGEDGYGDDELDFAGAEYNGGEPELAMVDGDYEIGESVKTTFKYVPTFESFIGSQKLNEAKVKLGRLDANNVDKHPEKWEAVLDILKGAIGKTISGADLKKVIGNQQFGQQDADNKAMKAAKVEITDVRIATSTFGAQWSIDYKYDTEFFGNNAGLKFKDISGLDYEFGTNDISIAPTPKGSKTLARVADMFSLGDIIL